MMKSMSDIWLSIVSQWNAIKNNVSFKYYAFETGVISVIRHIEYVLILLFTPLRKLFGLVWIYIVSPHRAYANNVVFNYALQNGIYLKRLLERKPVHIHGSVNPLVTLGWELQDVHHVGRKGFVKYRKISWIEYKLVFWLIWGWLDADSNEDTYDAGYNVTLINKERKSMTWLPAFILASLEKANTGSVYGNTFDLGDLRAEDPQFNFWATTLWNIRNTAYNFRYMHWESPTQHFLYKVGNWEFGWKQDESWNDIDGKPNYSLVAFGWN